jgi:hypothetical protein
VILAAGARPFVDGQVEARQWPSHHRHGLASRRLDRWNQARMLKADRLLKMVAYQRHALSV